MVNYSSDFVAILHENPLGWEYTERSKLGLDHFKFEEIDLLFWRDFTRANWAVPLFIAPAYLAVVLGLQRWMKEREAFKLDAVLRVWNLLLGIFSIFGLIRTTPGILKVLSEEPDGFYQSICEKKNADANVGFWILIFFFSKILQFGDTVFLALRKKPLTFHHLAHHCLAMFVCWLIVPFLEPVARWCMVLNFSEHAVMYPYFFLRSFNNFKMPVIIPNIITTFQFVTVAAGTFLQVLTIYFYQAGYDCARDPFISEVCVGAAVIFTFLFAKQFYDFVLMKGREKKEAERKKQ